MHNTYEEEEEEEESQLLLRVAHGWLGRSNSGTRMFPSPSWEPVRNGSCCVMEDGEEEEQPRGGAVCFASGILRLMKCFKVGTNSWRSQTRLHFVFLAEIIIIFSYCLINVHLCCLYVFI